VRLGNTGRGKGRDARTSVGLDIGSSAVRAAEIHQEGNRRILCRFSQVELERGAVVDGEVLKPEPVAAALRRLWEEAKFSTRRVIVGVSSQRVIVRPAEVAAMPAEEFRLALQFEAQELIPMPVDEAVLDFRILDPEIDTDAATGNKRMRILLAAAHREMIHGHLEALKLAGLEPEAVDLLPLALLRAVPEDRSSPENVDAVVSIGSDLTTVAVREDGIARFARTVGLGGSKLTNSIATDLDYDVEAAEQVKRDANAPVQVRERVRQVVDLELAAIVNEINSSLDYYLAQTDRVAVDRVIVTGGACRTDGLLEALAREVGTMVALANPVQGLVVEDTGLVGEAATQAVGAVGLALWALADPARRVSLLPREVIALRRQRQVTRRMVAGLVALAVVLSGAWVLRHLQVSSVDRQVASYQATNRSLQGQVSSLSGVTTVKTAIASQRALATSALKGNVDWVRLLGQVAAVMPSGASLSSFSGSATAPTTSSQPSSSGPQPLGALQMTVSGPGGQELPAEWLRALARIPGLTGVTVSGSATDGSKDSFSSAASVDDLGTSQRAQALPGGQP
jgi:type IV pilus assembly protein PilM